MSRMTGAKGAVTRARRRPAALETAALGQIAETVSAVQRAGLDNIDSMTTRRSGRLRGWYRKAVRRASVSGFVGYISARARRAAFHARFVHDGTATARARPFHEDAVEETAPIHAVGMRQALRAALRKTSPSSLARTGGRAERGVK